MNRYILSLSLAALSVLMMNQAAYAQQRMVLYEEFTGEDCTPCAGQNPGLWALMQSAGNSSKVLLIKYMAPYYGPFSQQDVNDEITRYNYYNIDFWPSGLMDGTLPDTTDSFSISPGNLTQAMIDREYATPSPFTLSASYVWNATFDSITTTINIKAVNNFNPAGANMYLRIALAETVNFNQPPGINGERNFENVVRCMYPDANGIPIANSWVAGATQTITITGPVPAYVDKSAPFIVAWMQNDNDLTIQQTAKSANTLLPVDAGIKTLPILFCAPESAFAPTVSLINTGAAALTSANIYYRFNGGSLTLLPWTGYLSTGDYASISLIDLPPGSYTLYDSVSAPNGRNDINIINNADSNTVVIKANTPQTIPLGTEFVSGAPVGWTFFDANANGLNWQLARNVPTHNGVGTNAAVHGNFGAYFWESNYLILPATVTIPKSLVFWEAYAFTAMDSLEIVYSSDCGSSWTSIWSADASTLATVVSIPPNTPFIPEGTQWKMFTANVSMVPEGALIAFRASTYNGNNMYVGDITLSDQIDAVANVTSIPTGVNVYPVPAKDVVNISFSLPEASNVQLMLYDETGRTVMDRKSGFMDKGAHLTTIETGGFAGGIYILSVKTDETTNTKKVMVIP